MNTGKRIISLLMCMLMVLTMVPMSVFAVEATEIDTINIEGLPVPLYGQTVEEYYTAILDERGGGTLTVNDETFNKSAGKYGNLFDEGLEVKKNDTVLSSTSTELITEGDYYVAMTLYPADGYVIPADVAVTVDGAVSVEKDFDEYGSLIAYAKYEVKATKIDTVHIEGIPAPLYGQTVGEYNDVMRAGSMNGTHKINGSTRVNIAEDVFYGNIELSDWEYYNSEKSYIAPSSADNLPSVYYLVHWLYPAAGYKFPDDVAVTVDGAVSVETELDEDGCLAVWAKFEVAPPTVIDTINIEGVFAPLYGQVPKYYLDDVIAKVKVNNEPYDSINQTYGNLNVEWQAIFDSTKANSLLSSSEIFSEGTYYYQLQLYPKTGFVFADIDDISASVNGNASVELEPSTVYDDTVLVWVKFEVAIPAPAPESDFQTDTYEDGVSVIYKGSDSVVVVPSEIGGKKVLKIENDAFPDCVECVVIPETVKSIKTVWAFDGKNIKSIEVDEDNAYYSSVNGVLFNKDKTALLKYPRGNATKNYTVHDTVKTIGKNAFWKAANLKNIIIPEGVTTIEKEAFTDCTALESIDLPKSITFIDYRAFKSCKNLESVVLPEIPVISFDSFYGCTKLKEITIPASVKRIEAYAFADCSGLQIVNYIGDEEMWNQVLVESDHNTPLLNATFKFCAHENTTTGYIAPTCAEEGYTEGERCNNCKKILSKSGAIPTLPHTYDNGDDAECNVCGTVRFIRIEGLPAPEYGQTVEQWYNIYGENWENGTFNINGVEGNDDWIFGSIECDGIYQLDKNKEIISDYSMIISEGVYYWCIDVAPVNDIKFPDDLKIIVDGVNEKDIELDSYGNGWFSIKIKYKLCVHTYDNACDINCNKCGETRTVPAHTGGTATCTEKAKCSVCGEAYGSVNKNNHKSITTLKAVAATYKADGKTEGKKCTVCGTVTVPQKKVARKTLKKVSGIKTKAVKLASGTKSTLTLSWSKVTGAEKYQVQQYVNKKWKTIKTTSKTSYTVTKLKANKSYKFRVRAVAGKYYGKYSSTYTAKTVPLKTTLTLKAGKKALTASWKTVANITGYEVTYSTSKKFTKKTTKTVTIKKAKTKKTTIKKLSKGKKYYVKVRAYKIVGSKKIYSAWSSVKNIKVK